MRIIAVTSIFLLSIGAASAQDVKGSADHPLIPRYEGSDIIRFERESFTEYPLLVGPVKKGGISDNPDSINEIEGKLTRLTYRAPTERAVLEVFRNYEKALADAGFKPLYTCKQKECGTSKFNEIVERKRTIEMWGDGSHRYLATHLSRDEGDVYVSLYMTRNQSGGRDRGRTMIQLDVIELKPMEQRMVVVEASTMQRDLKAKGRVAIYGLHFDFDKDTLRPDSKPQLDEIGKLLSANPSLAVMIVGHTDSQGSATYNLELSQRRANRVVEALVRDYRIDKGRMTPFGAGMSSPVATNATDEGRALNRRVELVQP